MKFKAGDHVLIDLEVAQARCSTVITQCCGRAWDQAALHGLLRCAAEGEWRVAEVQIRLSQCAYCGHCSPKPRGEITLEASSLVLVGGSEKRYWSVPRSWLRLAPGSP